MATASLVGAKGGASAAEREKEDAEEEEEEANAMQMEGAQTEEQKNEERKLRGVLAQSLDRVQYDRYEKWRGVRIPEAPVRRVSPLLPLASFQTPNPNNYNRLPTRPP